MGGFIGGLDKGCVSEISRKGNSSLLAFMLCLFLLRFFFLPFFVVCVLLCGGRRGHRHALLSLSLLYLFFHVTYYSMLSFLFVCFDSKNSLFISWFAFAHRFLVVLPPSLPPSFPPSLFHSPSLTYFHSLKC